jgi:hypothetical protein
VTSKDRLALYQDPSVQLLLSKFVRGEIVELVPSFDLNQTVRYPEVEEIVEGDSGAAKQLVEKLWDVGIFKRKFHVKILVCPSCLSVNVRPCSNILPVGTLTVSITFSSKEVCSARNATRSCLRPELIIRSSVPGFNAVNAENVPTCLARYIDAETVVTSSQ